MPSAVFGYTVADLISYAWRSVLPFTQPLADCVGCEFGIRVEGWPVRVPTTSASASSGGENGGGGGGQPARAVPRSPSDAVQLADEPRALLFNARNAEDRDQFIDDLQEGIIEVLVRLPDRASRSCLPILVDSYT